MPKEWLERTAPKRPILCGVGRKTVTYIHHRMNHVNSCNGIAMMIAP